GISTAPGSDSVYAAFNERVVALNPTSGAVEWEYPDKASRNATFYAVPVVDNGTIYIGDYEGRMHAIDTSGKEVWVYEPPKETIIGPLSLTAKDRVISGVAVDSDLVFFGLGSRNVVALSRETGQRVWEFKTDHGVWATPLYLPANPDVPSSQATLYVLSLDHYLYAIEPETGQELWRQYLGGAAPGNLVYDSTRNRVYVGTFISELLAVDLTTHEIMYRFKADDWLWDGPALDGDMLYFGDLAGSLYALRITDNGFEQVWKKKVAQDGIRATPLVTGDTVIVGSQDNRVYAVSKEDGSTRWSLNTGGQALSELILIPGDSESPDLVVVGTDKSGKLVFAYTVDTGEERWRYPA
ncbi:MAG TPA: PQQ-binding-like beta-propeller repeat protein, partial [Aggregatilineaceae bacterium]|nr:PQQ-binding-like beta-propeller repeat protein [Aggregatilineaceae bacterium]